MRLNKYIAESGLCSRRAADRLIESGKVTVNGKSSTQLGTIIDAENDVITVNETPLERHKEKILIMFHKPSGYACTRQDPHAEKTIYDLLPANFQELHSIGRLDQESEGLLLLTNDGGFTERMTHPKYKCNKTYEVIIKGQLSPEKIERLEKGIEIEETIKHVKKVYKTQPCTIKKIPSTLQKTGKSRFRITLSEGRNRQIRKMLQKVGNPVVYLKRFSMGPYQLGDLEKGKWQTLSL